MIPKIVIHNRYLEARKANIDSWKIPREERRALRRFLEDLAQGKVNKGKRISEARQVKYLELLKIPLQFFGKPAPRLTLRDIERFEKGLNSVQFQSIKGQPYAHSTKVDIRRLLQIYLRWRLGRPKADKLTDWLDTRDIFQTPDFLKETEVEKLYKACKSAEERFIIAVLFDTGARAEEFHNIRYEDVSLPDTTGSYPKIALKEEYSKTKGRTVSLYWKHSLEAVRDYLAQREQEGIRAGEPVIFRRYDNVRFFLIRLGKKVLGRSIHYHLFRHSSATYYADKMNRQQMCIRYGWTFSSRMPDIYIARAGVDSQELDQRFKGTEVETLKNSLAKMEQHARLKDDQIKQLEQAMETMERNMQAIAEIMRLNPTEEAVQAAIQRKKIKEAVPADRQY